MHSWFAVHCTSMNYTNTLISGDNKGYAAYLMEKDMNNGALPGQVRKCIAQRFYMSSNDLGFPVPFLSLGRFCCRFCSN